MTNSNGDRDKYVFVYKYADLVYLYLNDYSVMYLIKYCFKYTL